MHGISLLLEFYRITLPELLPLGRVMVEPFAKLRARSHIFEPQVEVCMFLADAARPEPLYQHPETVFCRRCLVNPLELEHDAKTLLHLAAAGTGSRNSVFQLMTPARIRDAFRKAVFPGVQRICRVARDPRQRNL